MQAYSRHTDKPQLKRFRKETRYMHNRSEGLRGERGFVPRQRKLRATDARGVGYVWQD